MGDHDIEIPEIPDLTHPIWEDEPSSTYGTPLRSYHYMVWTSPNDASQFMGYMNSNY